MGDPEYVDVPIGGLTSKEYAKKQAEQIPVSYTHLDVYKRQPGGVKHYRPVILSDKRFRLFENQKGNEQKQEYGQETPVMFQFHCATSQLCK